MFQKKMIISAFFRLNDHPKRKRTLTLSGWASLLGNDWLPLSETYVPIRARQRAGEVVTAVIVIPPAAFLEEPFHEVVQTVPVESGKT